MAEKKKGIRIVVVVEDRMLERFCRESLLELGYHRKEIRVEVAVAGKGSGKVWVDKAFAEEVKILRQKRNQALAVLAGTDVDEMTIPQRIENLRQALLDISEEDREDAERIAYWLPRWSIETWLKRLQGDDVVETASYKGKVKVPNFAELAAEFIRMYRAKEDSRIPSMDLAFKETARIES